jgi:hypothetical protein
MRRVISILLAGLFLLHVMSECFSHHGHPAEMIVPSAGCSGPSSAHTSGTAPCGHQHGSGHGNCQGSHCVFVRDKSRSETDIERASGKLVRRVTFSIHGSAGCRNGRQTELNPTRSQHVRLHLQLQVLLV